MKSSFNTNSYISNEFNETVHLHKLFKHCWSDCNNMHYSMSQAFIYSAIWRNHLVLVEGVESVLCATLTESTDCSVDKPAN